MTRWKTAFVAVLVVGSTTACFRQVVQTGRASGQTVIKKDWVSTWIFGIVPAEPIETRAQCPSGVAIVETQTSFANGLVGALTLGIWAPQTVTITCAAGTASLPPGTEVLHVAADASDAVVARVLADAAERSAQNSRSVAVQFGDATSAKE